MLIDAELLARLPSDAKLTVTVEVGALRQAMEMLTGGKAVLSTRECAAEFGWSDKDWRRWAPTLEGALRVGGKAWRIPRAAAEQKVSELMKIDGRAKVFTQGLRRGGNYGKFRSKAASTPTASDRSEIVSLSGRVRRSRLPIPGPGPDRPA